MRRLALCLLCACGGARTAAPTAPGGAGFAADADAFYWAEYDHSPQSAVVLGHHQYDGKLPDVSRSALDAWLAELNRTYDKLAAYRDLAGTERLEREVVLRRIDGERFAIARLRAPYLNPMSYLGALELVYYVARDYAPLAARAEAVIAIARGTRAYLRQADQNLERRIARPFIETAVLQVEGSIEFLAKDIPQAFARLPDQARLRAALAEMSSALGEYGQAISRREPTETFALGEKDFLDYLEATEGVRMDLQTLMRIANETLDRDGKAMVAAAAQVDPKATPFAVLAKLPRPPVDGVLAAAEKQSAEMRRFIIDKQIVTIPSDDPAEVHETPPFMRWNGAFLDPSGQFEKKPLPSFYYITPPDPSWPRERQLASLDTEVDLLFTTIHEVWPGHFLHKLHMDKNPSRIMKSFCSYQMGEGWAHYAEEMMWEQGVGGGDPKVHIGQLSNALLRDARFASALGLHTAGMSIAASAKLFHDKGFQGEETSRQQAVRGTFDPLYLNYTLGKLIIKKLRADYQKKLGPGYSLKGFHDALLGYGCAPLPLIREQMLGDAKGLL
jgi:uncharacterized protein (DUF885 family)